METMYIQNRRSVSIQGKAREVPGIQVGREQCLHDAGASEQRQLTIVIDHTGLNLLAFRADEVEALDIASIHH